MRSNLKELVEKYVQSGEVLELGQPLYKGMPGLGVHPTYMFSLYKNHGDVINEDGTSAATDIIVLGGHVGTHIDAVGHISKDMKLFGGYDARSHQTGQGGLKVNGIEHTEPLILRGTLIDLCGNGEPLPPGKVIQLDDIKPLPDIEAGDAVLIRTGWARYFSDPNRFGNLREGVPGIGTSVAAWLVDRKVRVVGADNIALEAFKEPITCLPVHSLLLAEHGTQIIEMLNLEELATRLRGHFVFVALPLLIIGGTASPIRPIALI